MLVVQGITKDGSRFRPSTWVEMLVGRYTMAEVLFHGDAFQTEAQHCISISKYIQVCCNVHGYCEIHVLEELKTFDPTVYDHIKFFAISNNLQYIET